MREATGSAINLLLEAGHLTVENMGTSVLAICVGLIYFAITLIRAYRKGGRRHVKKMDIVWGVAFTLGVWALAFIWSLGVATYQEHKAIKASLLEMQLTNTDQSQEINRLKQVLSVRDASIIGLQDQVRNQQTTISGALLQLGKAQGEEIQPLRLTPYFIGTTVARTNVKLGTNQGTFILLSNKIVTPIRILVSCQKDITVASGEVLGTGSELRGGWGGRVTNSNNEYGIGILSPAMAPSNPLLVTVYANQNEIGNCTFVQR